MGFRNKCFNALGSFHGRRFTAMLKGFLFISLAILGGVSGASRRDSVSEGAVAVGDSTIREVEKIGRDGIEWHFDRPYKTGTFADGDLWVLGPV